MAVSCSLDPAQKKFRILCLSGGGFAGLYTIRILAKLESRYGYPIGEKFDLIAGTSVGGLIALSIALRRKMVELEGLFEQEGSKIFHATRFSRVFGYYKLYRNIFNSRFTQQRLKDLILRVIGEDDHFSALKNKIFIPTVNLTEGRPQEFRRGDEEIFQGIKISDLALATTAAPTYFPIHKINGQFYADGGLYANLPDSLAMVEAASEYGVPLSDIHMLSIGSTYSTRTIGWPKKRQLGILDWLIRFNVIRSILDSQEQTSIFVCDRMIGDRYIRINKYLEPTRANLVALAKADYQAISILRAAADDTWWLLLRNKGRISRLDNFFAEPGNKIGN